MDKLKQRIAALLYNAGLSADMATGCGLLAAGASGVLVVQGQFFWAGVFLLLSGLLDLLDGAIARVSGKGDSFGGILDSSLDRYGDFFVLAAIAYYCAQNGYSGSLGLTLSAIMGSFEISYIRARAECVIPKCKIGFWERGERLVYLSLGLLLGNIACVLWVLAIGTHLTAAARLWEARRLTRLGATEEIRLRGLKQVLIHAGTRANSWYLAKAFFWFFVVVFIRVPLGPAY